MKEIEALSSITSESLKDEVLELLEVVKKYPLLSGERDYLSRKGYYVGLKKDARQHIDLLEAIALVRDKNRGGECLSNYLSNVQKAKEKESSLELVKNKSSLSYSHTKQDTIKADGSCKYCGYHFNFCKCED